MVLGFKPIVDVKPPLPVSLHCFAPIWSNPASSSVGFVEVAKAAGNRGVIIAPLLLITNVGFSDYFQPV